MLVLNELFIVQNNSFILCPYIMQQERLATHANKKIILSVEGNIGAGKTTLLDNLQKKITSENLCHIAIVREPVDEWETIKDPITGETILQKFYLDIKQYAFTFQFMAFVSRVQALKRAIAEHPHAYIFVCERSLHADAYIFAKMLYDDGYMDSIHYQVYCKMYQASIADFPLDMVMYLDIDPETCKQRIQKRSRDGEENISMDYLVKCHNYHQAWLKLRGGEGCGSGGEDPLSVVSLKNDDDISQFIDLCIDPEFLQGVFGLK